jgi:phosphate/sulfate permease
MTALVLLFVVTLFVAYANGANDNFKGVATLYGANVTSYGTAIAIATIATFLGCMASVVFAEALITAFSGKGLVPDALAASPVFLLAVGTGAGATVLLSTLLGFPISTTHSLTGALAGGRPHGGRQRPKSERARLQLLSAAAAEPRRFDLSHDPGLQSEACLEQSVRHWEA